MDTRLELCVPQVSLESVDHGTGLIRRGYRTAVGRHRKKSLLPAELGYDLGESVYAYDNSVARRQLYWLNSYVVQVIMSSEHGRLWQISRRTHPTIPITLVVLILANQRLVLSILSVLLVNL